MTRAELRLTIGTHLLTARLEAKAAPISCARFRSLLPLHRSLLHARWSGECGWAPLGPLPFDLAAENTTERPTPGQILIYAGALSEPEILVPYGAAAFACRGGPLAGNHFMTVVEGADELPGIGSALLWRGALPIVVQSL